MKERDKNEVDMVAVVVALRFRIFREKDEHLRANHGVARGRDIVLFLTDHLLTVERGKDNVSRSMKQAVFHSYVIEQQRAGDRWSFARQNERPEQLLFLEKER